MPSVFAGWIFAPKCPCNYDPVTPALIRQTEKDLEQSEGKNNGFQPLLQMAPSIV